MQWKHEAIRIQEVRDTTRHYTRTHQQSTNTALGLNQRTSMKDRHQTTTQERWNTLNLHKPETQPIRRNLTSTTIAMPQRIQPNNMNMKRAIINLATIWCNPDIRNTPFWHRRTVGHHRNGLPILPRWGTNSDQQPSNLAHSGTKSG